MLGTTPRRTLTPFSTLLQWRLPDRGVAEVPAGHPLYGPDGPAADFYLVVDGLVTLARARADGTETALDVRAAGDTFGESVLAGTPPAGESARALAHTKVRKWPACEVVELLATDGEAALAAARMTIRRAAAWRERLVLLGREPAPRRLARTLLYLREKAGPALPPLGDAVLGALAATSAAMAGDCLARFERLGLVATTTAGMIVRPALADWLRDS